MEACFCDLYADAAGDGEPIERYEAKRLTTRKAHACEECGDAIPVGAHAERVTGLWEGRRICWYTCEVCLRIRDDLMGGCFMHGTMREDIKSCLGIDYITGEINEEWIEE